VDKPLAQDLRLGIEVDRSGLYGYTNQSTSLGSCWALSRFAGNSTQRHASMFIIEGADNLGKTTAAQKILALSAKRAEHGLSPAAPTYYAHMSRPNAAFDFCHDYLDMMSRHAIQDRFHLGGLVWHQGVLTPDKLNFVEGHLMTLGSFLVVFYTSDDEWYKKSLMASTKEEMFDPTTIVEANAKFRDNIPYTSRMIDIMYDVKDGQWPSEETLNDWLFRWLERMEETHAPVSH